MPRRKADSYDRDRINQWHQDTQAGPEAAALRAEIRLALGRLAQAGNGIPPPSLINLLVYGGSNDQMKEVLERFYRRYPELKSAPDDAPTPPAP